jgi:hypothetical protein
MPSRPAKVKEFRNMAKNPAVYAAAGSPSNQVKNTSGATPDGVSAEAAQDCTAPPSA